MNGVGVDGFGEVGTDGALLCLLRIGGAHQFAVLGDGVLAFQGLDHHRTGGHEGNQILEEGALFVHGVELAGFLLGQPGHAGSDDLQAGAFKTGIDLADHVLFDGVRLDDGKGAFDSHGFAPRKLVS